jgi:hypothetical protein
MSSEWAHRVRALTIPERTRRAGAPDGTRREQVAAGQRDRRRLRRDESRERRVVSTSLAARRQHRCACACVRAFVVLQYALALENRPYMLRSSTIV